QVYYELVINTKGKEIYIKLSKNWQIIKATETQQKKLQLRGKDAIEVSDFLSIQVEKTTTIKSSVSPPFKGWALYYCYISEREHQMAHRAIARGKTCP
ncbi:hypothetical protein, partial [Pseudoalteromonas sp. MMG012]|uniref:hypothetical protein n=1 Tax=Pseudoalteromonas sp. MMG012 TaxID=2822686 RepID=UPI001B3A37D4